ncbi:MAG: asparagine synthase (glutamine-hydrolyzing) [Planctomycetota bacterium]|jgi:asparagine synthase (glutamine-hydrolysing)
MCGIAGIVNFDVDQLDRRVIEDMIDVLRHRGPDGEGIFGDNNVVLGHVRLSIIDVEGSRQPLSNEDESIWTTFNGEIYNYPELRKTLTAMGHRFKTNGDTETLVHLYEQYGEDMVHHLQGMFAFAIWDKRKRLLLLARDRLGIKPLYCCRKGSDFIFASEPKAFFRHPAIDARPNIEGIWHYLTYRSVPAPGTLFEGITKVRPGHMMVVTQNGCTEKCYWDIPLDAKGSKSLFKGRRAEDVTEEVESLLLKSVKRRLISDVPLGAFLSGGVDSSLVVAMMSRITGTPVRTYSVGFPNFASSELPYAGIVADLYKTEHHELMLEEDYFVEHLEKLTCLRDSPLSEPADVPLYLLAKMASRDVKVLLSGEGGDELFGGYPKSAYDRFAPLINIWPEVLTRLAGGLMPPRFRRIEVALRSLCQKDPADRWAQWFSPFTEREKLNLVNSSNSWENPTKQYVENSRGCNTLDAMLYTDCKLWLPDNLLERGDRMTMAASVECRVPFLDHEMVELAFSLPTSLKVRGFTRKWQVKQIALKYLPAGIVHRRKVGFSVPLSQWFRGKLRDTCYDRICQANGSLGDYLNRTQLQKILDDHCSCRKDNALKIWTLLGLSIWNHVFCNNSVASPAREKAVPETK